MLWHFPDPGDTAEGKTTLRVAEIELVLLRHPSALQGSVGNVWDPRRGLSSGLGQRIPKLRASHSCPDLSILSDRDDEISKETGTGSHLRI